MKKNAFRERLASKSTNLSHFRCVLKSSAQTEALVEKNTLELLNTVMNLILKEDQSSESRIAKFPLTMAKYLLLP